MAVHKIVILVCYYYFVISCMVGITKGQLRVGFYEDTCPDAESIVSGFVSDAAQSDRNFIPVLLRLHFHDCFVEGCDGSILIEQGPTSEHVAFGHQGVGGRDIIENAKAHLEATCPGVVSCADIVALAARDAVALANGPAYEVPTGRRDGIVSDIRLADNMPEVTDSIETLKFKFLEKGLSDKDLVLLSAAHTIGTTACFFMKDRLYNFPPQGGPDPSINPQILPELTSNCPPNGDINIRIPIDHNSGETFDNQILENIRDGFAVLQSDAALYQDDVTKEIVDSYLDPQFGPSFEADFAEAMIKMGQIGVKTGDFGEIRRVCSSFN